MKKASLTTHLRSKEFRGASPWPFGQRLGVLVWEYAWLLLCAWTPKPFNVWRLVVFRIFGGRVDGRPFLHPRTRIQIPWNVALHDGACTGDRANLYSLDRITLMPGCVVAQEAYLCTGTHDFSHEAFPLMTAPITVETNAFVGARAFVLPGVTVGRGAVVGACSVVTRDVPERTVVRGNPATPFGLK